MFKQFSENYKLSHKYNTIQYNSGLDIRHFIKLGGTLWPMQ